MSLKIREDHVVEIEYVLSDVEDNILDSSEDGEPLSYLHGHGNIVPGLEAALSGKTAGDEVHVAVSPELGYGERDPDLTRVLPLSHFSDLDEEIEEGMMFEAEDDDGEPLLVTVVAIDGDEITVDGNHPLAGMTLNFDVKVISVREATAEELKHGHVHGHGEHDH